MKGVLIVVWALLFGGQAFAAAPAKPAAAWDGLSSIHIRKGDVVDDSKVRMDRGKLGKLPFRLKPGDHIIAKFVRLETGPNGEAWEVWMAMRSNPCTPPTHCRNWMGGEFTLRKRGEVTCQCEGELEFTLLRAPVPPPPDSPPPTPPRVVPPPPGEAPTLSYGFQPLPMAGYHNQGVPRQQRYTAVAPFGFRLRDRISAVGQGGSASSSSTSSATASVSGGSGGSNPPATAAGSGGTAAPGP